MSTYSKWSIDNVGCVEFITRINDSPITLRRPTNFQDDAAKKWNPTEQRCQKFCLGFKIVVSANKVGGG